MSLPALLFFMAGCGGFTASKSVSPASFLLPGFLQAAPQPTHPDSTLPAVEPGTEVAQF
jgi:hypothetical protein